MAKYKQILFDLDGTITDPAVGITNSVMYALDKFGISVNDRSTLYKFIGPPLDESFEAYYGFSPDQSQKAILYYREYYSKKGIFENRIYGGIEELLCKIKDAGKSIILATSKPEVFAKQILEHFNLSKHFTFIAGSNLNGSRVKKAEVIEYALKNCSITDVSGAIMIGDRKHDIIGAKQNRIASIGVLFGYGGEEELTEAGADFIVKNIADIESIVL